MKITTKLVISGKYIKDYGQGKPKFGRNWFFFLPRIRWNGGKFWKNEVVDVCFLWFIFCFIITYWGDNFVINTKYLPIRKTISNNK